MEYNCCGVTLSDAYWDCNCPDDSYQYIHPMSEKVCPKCGDHEEDCPQSHAAEVKAAGLIP